MEFGKTSKRIVSYLDQHWSGLSEKVNDKFMEDMIRKYERNVEEGMRDEEAVRFATLYFRVCKPYLGELENRERLRVCDGGF